MWKEERKKQNKKKKNEKVFIKKLEEKAWGDWKTGVAAD